MNVSGLSLRVLGLISSGSGESHLLKDWGGELYFPHPYPGDSQPGDFMHCLV